MQRKFIALFLLILCPLIMSANSLADESTPPLADRHIAKGVNCQNCHGEGTPNAEISMANCLACHGGNYEKLAGTTDEGDINYHATHLGEPNCTECHQGHKASFLICDQCHEFKVKVP